VLGDIVGQNYLEYLQKVFSQHFVVYFLGPILVQPVVALKNVLEASKALAKQHISNLALGALVVADPARLEIIVPLYELVDDRKRNHCAQRNKCHGKPG